MSAEELNRLLERYYNGESTEDEENLLRSFFSGNEVPEGYEAEKEIFSFYSRNVRIPEPSPGFEARLIEGIDRSERLAASLKIRKILMPWLSAAAAIIIMFGSWFVFVHKNEPRDTFTDPKIAYAETMKILRDVSVRFNQAARSLEPVGRFNEAANESMKTINRSSEIVRKNLKSLGYLNKASGNSGKPVETKK
jgi:hypothetical protein